MRREYFIGVLVYSVMARDAPEYLLTKLNDYLLADLKLRRSERLTVTAFAPPKARTEAFKNSLALIAMNLLNSVSVTEFEPENLHRFKKVLFNALHLRDRQDWNKRVLLEGIVQNSRSTTARLLLPSRL